MRTLSANRPFADRADDPRSVGGAPKPPVLSRRTQRLLCLLSLAVILYGTIGPIAGARAWVVPPDTWRWIPLAHRNDANDVLTNVVVYVPVGIALRLLLRRRGHAGPADFVVAAVLASGLSYATELVQQAMPARSSNLNDFWINSGAGAAGCLLAVRLQTCLRRMHALLFEAVHLRVTAWGVLAILGAVATVLVMTLPWDPRRPRVVLAYQGAPAADALWLLRVVVFGVLGFVMAGRGRLRGGTCAGAFAATVLKIGLLALAVEAGQSLLSGRVSSLVHALVAAAGAAIGALLAIRYVDPRSRSAPSSSPAQARLAFAVLALLLLAILTRIGGPFDPDKAARTTHVWLPFHAHFHAPFGRAVTDIVQTTLLYAGLTWLCLLTARRRGRAAALLLTLGVVGIQELSGPMWTGRGIETTTPLLALVGWQLALRTWDALQPHRTAYAEQPLPAT